MHLVRIRVAYNGPILHPHTCLCPLSFMEEDSKTIKRQKKMPNTSCAWNSQPFGGSEMPYSLVVIEKLKQYALSIALIQPIVVLFSPPFLSASAYNAQNEIPKQNHDPNSVMLKQLWAHKNRDCDHEPIERKAAVWK